MVLAIMPPPTFPLQRSLDLHEADADAHKFCGILLARSAADTKQKIANGYEIKRHTEVRLCTRYLSYLSA